MAAKELEIAAENIVTVAAKVPEVYAALLSCWHSLHVYLAPHLPVLRGSLLPFPLAGIPCPVHGLSSLALALPVLHGLHPLLTVPSEAKADQDQQMYTSVGCS